MSEWLRTRAEDHARRWEKLLLMVRRVAQGMRSQIVARIAIAKAQRSIDRKIKNQRKGRRR